MEPNIIIRSDGVVVRIAMDNHESGLPQAQALVEIANALWALHAAFLHGTGNITISGEKGGEPIEIHDSQFTTDSDGALWVRDIHG